MSLFGFLADPTGKFDLSEERRKALISSRPKPGANLFKKEPQTNPSLPPRSPDDRILYPQSSITRQELLKEYPSMEEIQRLQRERLEEIDRIYQEKVRMEEERENRERAEWNERRRKQGQEEGKAFRNRASDGSPDQESS